jgi:hypothetical protein
LVAQYHRLKQTILAEVNQLKIAMVLQHSVARDEHIVEENAPYLTGSILARIMNDDSSEDEVLMEFDVRHDNEGDTFEMNIDYPEGYMHLQNIQNKVNNKEVVVEQFVTIDKLADCFSKPLRKLDFKMLCDQFMLDNSSKKIN